MKILEVKNNLVKISFTAQDKLVLSGFVIIEDSQCPYVAQVMSLKADSGLNYAIVKLLFTFDNEGVVKNYNGTVPELSASVTSLSSDELLDILPIEEAFKLGKLAQQEFILNVDYSILEKNLLICSDKTENTDILISNTAKQITEKNNKSVIIDTDATINAENTLVFGKDFKLPLNYDTINFIYENDLNDVEPTSKAIIQDIFLEVQEYSKTVLDKFIPIDNFLAVVEAQYNELKIPELVLLKNRLLKYKEENVFAQDAKDIHSLRSAVRANMSTTFDISTVDGVIQKQIINYIYDEIDSLDLFVYALVKINNDNSDKRLIRKLIAPSKISTVISTNHNYKYLYELKDRASNMVLFAPQTMQHDFASYNIFLNKLNDNEAVVFGKATQNIPLIIEILPIEELDEMEFPKKEEALENESGQDDFSEESNSFSYDSMLEDSEPVQEEQPVEELPEEQEEEPIEEVPENEEEEVIVTEIEPEIETEPSIEIEDEIDEGELDEPEEIEVDEIIEPELPAFEEVVEDEVDNYEEIAEYEEEPSEEVYIEESSDSFFVEEEPLQFEEEAVEQQIIEEEPEFFEKADDLPDFNTEEETPSYDLTEDDLDYIQDVNITDNNNEEVPIYPVEELEVTSKDSTTYEPGDRVSHPKYGEGVVEKMIKYGNKMLCSISFEGGRRLLDPAMSEIQKI